MKMNRIKYLLFLELLIFVIIVPSYAQYGISPFDPKTYGNSSTTHKSSKTKADNDESVKPKLIIISKDGKFGVFDMSKKKTIIKPKYDEIQPFCEGYAIVTKNGKRGVIFQTGKEYIKSKYVEILPSPNCILKEDNNPLFRVKDKNRWCLMTNSGPVSLQYDSISVSPDCVFWGEVNDKEWITLNADGTEGVKEEATRKEMTTRILPDSNILFNDRIYNKKGILQMSDNSKVKKINVSDNEYLYSGSRIYSANDLYRPYYYREGNYTPADSPDGFYKTEKFGSEFLIREGSIYSISLFDRNYQLVQDIKTGKKGLLYKDSIILAPSFKDISNNKKFLSNKRITDESLDILSLIKPIDIFTIVIDEYSDEKELIAETERFANKICSNNPNCIINFVGKDKSRIWGLHEKSVDIPIPNSIVISYLHLPWIEYEDVLALYDPEGERIISGITGVSKIKENIEKITKDRKNGWVCVSEGRIENIVEPKFDTIESLDSIVGGWAGKIDEIPNIVVSKDGLKGIYSYSGKELLPCEFQSVEKLYRFMQDIKDVWLKVKKDNSYGLVSVDGKEILPCKYSHIKEDSDIDHIVYVTDSNGDLIRIDITEANRPITGYSSYGEDGRVYKKGKMGFIDVKTGKLLIPCIYDPNALGGGMYGPDNGRDTRIALGYENYNGAIIDIWTLGGKKIASRTFKRNDRFSMASFIEQMIGIEVGW